MTADPTKYGFRRTGSGRWRGTVGRNHVVLAVDMVNRGPDYRHEEPEWRAEAIVYHGDRRDTNHVATRSSEVAAIRALVDWVRDQGKRRTHGGGADDFDFTGGASNDA